MLAGVLNVILYAAITTFHFEDEMKYLPMTISVVARPYYTYLKWQSLFRESMQNEMNWLVKLFDTSFYFVALKSLGMVLKVFNVAAWLLTKVIALQ